MDDRYKGRYGSRERGQLRLTKLMVIDCYFSIPKRIRAVIRGAETFNGSII